MNKVACQYALLRFRPFIETGEFANVGVMLLAPEAGYFDFRLLKRYGRITQFFHQLDRKVYLNSHGLFKKELERFSSELNSVALGGDRYTRNLPLATDLFAELVRPREAVLQFDARRIVLADDPAAKLDALFDYYVERNFVTREYQERLLEGTVRRLLQRGQVGADYRSEKVGGTDFSVNFPFVRMVNERPEQIIKPLFLAQDEPTKVLTHGGQWVDKVRRLRKRNVLPAQVLFPVTAPAPDTKPYQAYEEIRDDLRAQEINVIAADDEESILNFVRATA